MSLHVHYRVLSLPFASHFLSFVVSLCLPPLHHFFFSLMLYISSRHGGLDTLNRHMFTLPWVGPLFELLSLIAKFCRTYKMMLCATHKNTQDHSPTILFNRLPVLFHSHLTHSTSQFYLPNSPLSPSSHCYALSHLIISSLSLCPPCSFSIYYHTCSNVNLIPPFSLSLSPSFSPLPLFIPLSNLLPHLLPFQSLYCRALMEAPGRLIGSPGCANSLS